MAATKTKRRIIVSNIPIRFKPFRDDMPTIDNLAKSLNKERPELVRLLVSEALKARRLKAVGKDETLDAIVDVQKKAVAAALTPLMEKLEGMSSQVTRLEGRVADEFDQAERKLSFIVLCVRFIVTEVIICRLLLRDYVHTAYVKFVESVGKPAKDVEHNFNTRLTTYKMEAGANLDDLTEAGTAALHAMAERTTGFRDA